MTRSLRDRLAAGPSRGLGAANAIAAEVIAGQSNAADLVQALAAEEPGIAIRAANALKKVQVANPDILAPLSGQILTAAANAGDLRVRWNLAAVIGRMPLKGAKRELAVDLMFEALRSESGFLRTFAMQALVNFSADDAALRTRVRPIVEQFAELGTASMRARARKLLPSVLR